MKKLSIKAAQEAAQLAEQRQKVARIKWRLTAFESGVQVSFTPDEPLCWALEVYRARELARIDGRLGELGFESPAPEPEPETPEEKRARLDREATTATLRMFREGQKPKDWNLPPPPYRVPMPGGVDVGEAVSLVRDAETAGRG